MSYQDLLYPDTWQDQLKSVIFVSVVLIIIFTQIDSWPTKSLRTWVLTHHNSDYLN